VRKPFHCAARDIRGLGNSRASHTSDKRRSCTARIMRAATSGGASEGFEPTEPKRRGQPPAPVRSPNTGQAKRLRPALQLAGSSPHAMT